MRPHRRAFDVTPGSCRSTRRPPRELGASTHGALERIADELHRGQRRRWREGGPKWATAGSIDDWTAPKPSTP